MEEGLGLTFGARVCALGQKTLEGISKGGLPGGGVVVG